MRLLLALLSFTLLAAASPRDWSTVATRTPAGSYLIGNPAARVKLVEYASYTCSHCADFSVQSEPVLKRQMVRSGSTSLEVRHMIRDPLDLAAAVVARCAGPAGFARTSAAIFAAQAQWLPRAMDFQQFNQARLATYPLMAQLRAYADGAGLTAIGRAQGLSDARIAACFADEAEANRITAMTAAVPATVRATPTFFLNGRQLPPGTWAAVEPALRGAGAK